jgi:hypothetical protein
MITQLINFQFKKPFYQHLITTFILLLFVVWINLMIGPASVLAEPSKMLEITGDAVTTQVEFTLAELEAMEQYQQVYSTVNTWPTKRWYTARGVKIRDLLTLAGIKEEAKLIRFVSHDGYDVTLTVKELLKDKRYYYPGLKENHPGDGSIPGSTAGAQEVEPILALVSSEGSNDPKNMNDRDSLLLIFGQRAITEQTNNLFLKYVSKIEVLSTEPEKWDAPKANIPSGTVLPEGTLLTLSNKGNNEDKIYYTTDGSTPTVNSPMFNWSASRWWPLRDDLDGVNSPIEITKDTVIKAITIGPGKEDSEVVTFSFTVDYTGEAVDPTKVSGGPPTGVTLDRNTLNLKPGGTFRLEATIAPFNADDQQVTWRSSDTRVATVDTDGLVTVVGPGTAIITVQTVVGNHTATCIVNGPNAEDSGQDAVFLGSESLDNAAREKPVEAVEPLEEEPLSVNEAEHHRPEKNEADANEVLGIAHELPMNEQDAGEPPVDELSVPEGKGQYLAEKEVLAAGSSMTNSVTEQPASRYWQVFEVSPEVVLPLPMQEEQKWADFYAAGIFLFLFLSGVGKRYAEYAKEL